MKNKRLLLSFLWYCLLGPGRSMRFWQALSGWSGKNILTAKCFFNKIGEMDWNELVDTYYWDNRK